MKTGRGKVRRESEITLSEDQFRTLWPKTEGKRLEKTRYEISHGSYLVELDVCHGNLNGLQIAEVEFCSEDASNKFRPPPWFGQEVTGNWRYQNSTLVLQGLR